MQFDMLIAKISSYCIIFIVSGLFLWVPVKISDLLCFHLNIKFSNYLFIWVIIYNILMPSIIIPILKKLEEV